MRDFFQISLSFLYHTISSISYYAFYLIQIALYDSYYLFIFYSFFLYLFFFLISYSLVVCSDAFNDKNGDYHLNVNDSQVILLI